MRPSPILKTPALALLVVAVVAVASLAARAEPANPIRAAAISAHTKVLASDAFEGRQPGTAGEAKSVAYLIRQFRGLGLEPGGERGGWTQAVPITLQRVAGEAQVSLAVNGRREVLRRGGDVTIQARSREPQVRLADAPIVFAGYGVHRPGRGWDDFAGVDVRGKVLIELPGAPAKGPQPNDFDNYRSPRLKQLEAARQGAVGLIIVQPAGPEDWETTRVTGLWPQIEIAPEPGAEPAAPLFVGSLRRQVLQDALASAGLDLAALEAQAGKPGFTAQPLAGVSFSADYRMTRETLKTATVIGRISGKRRPDEVVIYSAHWDHLGRGPPEGYIGRAAVGPGASDDIYNGAIDNAAGVAAMLEIARAFKRGPPPDRTVAFISFTEEEPGLLGSEYYVKHPVYPLAKTVADLNLDTTPMALVRQVSVVGRGKTTLEDDLTTAAVAYGLSVSKTGGGGNYYLRSDHYQFAKAGVPALFIGSSGEADSTSTPWSRAYAETYMAEHYHHVSDAWRPQMDFRGAGQMAGVLYEVGRGLAFSDRWPDWTPQAGFKRAAAVAAPPGRP